jgi:N-acetylmuramoyl-L-alanine amidase
MKKKFYGITVAMSITVLSVSGLLTLGKTVNKNLLKEQIVLEKQTESNTPNICISIDTVVEVKEFDCVETQETETAERFTEKEKYMLAKIAMAEAEGCRIKAKELVIRTVLSRIESDMFPNTVEEVIFQKNQFTPISDGRWNKVEPNEECWQALENVLSSSESKDILFFESCKGDSWHNKNLKLVCEEDGMRFYK